MSDFVDTNVFLRFLARDDPDRTARSGELLRRAERGDIALATSEAIILEAVQVLSSRHLYHMPRALIAKIMQSMLENPGIQITHKRAVVRAFELYAATNLDYADCLAVEHAQRLGSRTIYSYDRDFDRIPELRRLEP